MELSARKCSLIALLFIIIIAAFLRFYKLDTIPASLNWDEIDAGYNAYTIANWGKDEWGKSFPLVFKSFLDDKRPVHIYAAAISVKLFGLNDFATRLPGAVVGTVSVLVIFLLVKQLFRNDLTALMAALLLALSPPHLHFSRGLWEINFSVFFLMVGLWLFYSALEGRRWRLPLAVVSFGISFFSSHSSIVVIPPLILLLIALNYRKVGQMFYPAIVSAGVVFIIIVLIVSNPSILGFARASQLSLNIDRLKETGLYQKTNIPQLGLLNIAADNYLKHFDYKFMFVSGDQSPRNSVKTFGEFYWIDALLLVFGLVSLILLRSKKTLVLLSWLVLAPLPSSLSGGVDIHRAAFMMGSMQILAALGATFLITKFPKKLQVLPIAAIVGALIFLAYGYINYYFTIFPKKDFIDWQYGMKEIVGYVKERNGYNKVYITDIRSQPYIFFLYYLKTPLPEFRQTVLYNDATNTKKFNLVSSFDKFYFGGWDIVESPPEMGNLYVVTNSQYDGLRYKSVFDVKKIIKYPDGGDAFYLVSYP